MSSNPFLIKPHPPPPPTPTFNQKEEKASPSSSSKNMSTTTTNTTSLPFQIPRPGFNHYSPYSGSPSSNYSLASLESPKPIDSINGSINYSPKHSRKPSSLTSSRNINMKNLSLNLNKPDTLPEKEDLTDPLPFNKPSITRRKTLTLSIPNNEELLTPNVSNTPIMPPLPKLPKKSQTTPQLSNFKFPLEQNDELNYQLNQSSDYNEYPNNLQSPFIINNEFINKVQSINLNDHKFKKLPEELQEKNQLNAYPNGPANVLNNQIYLFSDPNISDYKVNLNDYDLVINVAKECQDLSLNHENEYLYIPWSHNSSISKDLPNLTNQISKFDQPNKKILIHCQCGVSRSACVIVAYFMKKFKIGVNDAYDLLKNGTSNNDKLLAKDLSHKGYYIESCDRICPNMSLIFELMEFGDSIS